MLASINEEQSQVAAQDGGQVIDGEDGVRQPRVPVVLGVIREGPQPI